MWSGVFLFLRSRPKGMFSPQGDHSPHPLRELLCQSKGEECMQSAMSLSGSLLFGEKCMDATKIWESEYWAFSCCRARVRAWFALLVVIKTCSQWVWNSTTAALHNFSRISRCSRGVRSLVVCSWGQMKISPSKSDAIVLSWKREDCLLLLAQVEEFTHPWVMLLSGRRLEQEICRQISSLLETEKHKC